jgi:hypothetical protein
MVGLSGLRIVPKKKIKLDIKKIPDDILDFGAIDKAIADLESSIDQQHTISIKF